MMLRLVRQQQQQQQRRCRRLCSFRSSRGSRSSSGSCPSSEIQCHDANEDDTDTTANDNWHDGLVVMTVQQQHQPLSSSSTLFLTSRCRPVARSLMAVHHCRPIFSQQPTTYYYCNHFANAAVNVSQRRWKSVFVSKHNQSMNLTATDIIEHCQHNGLISSVKDYRQSPTHIILRECPFCNKPTRDEPDNLYKCYIQLVSGAYHCHRCGSGGSWFDWKLKLSPGNNLGRNVDPTGYDYVQQKAPSKIAPLPMPPQSLQKIYMSNLTATENSNTLNYLVNVRGLEKKTLIKYGIGQAEYKFSDNDGWRTSECVTFPWILKASDIGEQEKLRGATIDAEWKEKGDDAFLLRRLKVRSIEKKAWQRMDPAGGGWGLFGYHTLTDDDTEVVITEGEYDAMAVWQGTKRPAISLPNGCRSLPVEVLPMLERFEKIYLWMDNDAAGQEGAEMFARKIGLQRCLLVKPSLANCNGVESIEDLPKDANDALRKKLDLERIVADAKRVPHERIIHFSDLRKSVLDEIMYPDKYVGTPITSLPGLTEIIQGVRRGEMTVLTGPTGSGKTTYLGQMSLDLVEQGVNVLWGSFEIKNTRLMHKLMQQHAREPLPTGDPSMIDKLTALADKFEMLPFLFMKFHGGSDVDDVLDAMDYAVYVNDVEHIILDNMQFMVSLKSLGGKSSFDKFDVQDVAVEKFRKFATEKNVHVTLVVHPRKEQENTNLSMASIYGSAKATQEADTVMILQSDGRRKFLEIKKNRFNGNLGHVPLHFDRKSCRYTETPPIEVSFGKGKSPSGGNSSSSSEPPAASSQSKVKNPWKSMFS